MTNQSTLKVNQSWLFKDGNCTKKYYDGGGFAMTVDLEKSGYNEFLRKKRKQIENKKKLLAI